MAAKKTARKAKEVPARPTSESSNDSDEGAPEMEQEFHTDLEDEEMPDMEQEYHTTSSEASPEPEKTYNTPLLPLELLKSKSDSAPKPITIVDWEKMTSKEKKALRDERGISMKELRAQVVETGVIEAGRAAQRKRGILPANKVAGSRVAKKRKGKSQKAEMSGRQRMLQQRSIEAERSGKGSLPGSRKRKG